MAYLFDQTNFRWRSDDGNETGASWLAALDTAPTVLPDTTYRLRFIITNEGTTTHSIYPTLEYSLNGGSYVAVDNDSLVVRSQPSALVGDGTPTTQQIGSGSFAANSVDTAHGYGATTSLSASKSTEVEFCFQIRSADLSGDNTITFRVYDSFSEIDNYALTPSVSISIAPPVIPPTPPTPPARGSTLWQVGGGVLWTPKGILFCAKPPCPELCFPSSASSGSSIASSSHASSSPASHYHPPCNGCIPGTTPWAFILSLSGGITPYLGFVGLSSPLLLEYDAGTDLSYDLVVTKLDEYGQPYTAFIASITLQCLGDAVWVGLEMRLQLPPTPTYSFDSDSLRLTGPADCSKIARIITTGTLYLNPAFSNSTFAFVPA